MTMKEKKGMKMKKRERWLITAELFSPLLPLISLYWTKLTTFTFLDSCHFWFSHPHFPWLLRPNQQFNEEEEEDDEDGEERLYDDEEDEEEEEDYVHDEGTFYSDHDDANAGQFDRTVSKGRHKDGTVSNNDVNFLHVAKSWQGRAVEERKGLHEEVDYLHHCVCVCACAYSSLHLSQSFLFCLFLHIHLIDIAVSLEQEEGSDSDEEEEDDDDEEDNNEEEEDDEEEEDEEEDDEDEEGAKAENKVQEGESSREHVFPILVSELVKESILDKLQGTYKQANEHTLST